MANVGGSIALSFRRDLAAEYGKKMKKIGIYAKDDAELVMRNGWLDYPPHSVNSKDLIKQ